MEGCGDGRGGRRGVVMGRGGRRGVVMGSAGAEKMP